MSVAPDRVCVVVGRTRHKMIQVEVQEAVKRGGRFVELRLDFLAKAVDFRRLLPFKLSAWMATIRRPQDGGRWPGTEAERQIVLRQVIANQQFEWVDLETDIADEVRRFGSVQRVISYHNRTETPDDLDEIYERMLKQDGDVYKIAVMAQKAEDNLRVLEIQRRAKKPTVAFCMGDIGFPSRFLALKYGAPWIYAAFNKERGVAPGMPSVEEFRTTYPVRSIDADTEVFGLLGDPVGHSYSPVLHNHLFGRFKRNAIYLPFRVPKGELPAALKTFDSVPVGGYSVTIPHKEEAAALSKDHDLTVRITQAANTLVRKTDGVFAASNTDYTAAIDSLESHLAERSMTGPPVELHNQFVLILGAGGAARAIAHALHSKRAHIIVAARTYDRAAKLAAEISCKVVDWQGRHGVMPCDVVINCTPVGMHPNVDESPLHPSFLKPGLTIFDTVYTPENTLLVREARTRGCHVITGVDMFVRQAARQFELFTGIAPPIEKMRELLRKAMSPLTRALEEEAEEQRSEAAEGRPVTPPPRLFLIGYRGTGKSTVGPILGAALRWQFLDADEHIERLAGKTIAEIFAAEGEDGFRDLESAALAELCQQDGRVIATGGGVILRPFNRELLSTAGFVAWLTAPPQTVWERMQSDPTTAARRPNLTSGGFDEVANLMAARESLYRQTAHGTFPTAGRSPEVVAAAILVAWEAAAGPSSFPSSSG